MAKRNPTCDCGPCDILVNCHDCCRCVARLICVTLSQPTASGGDCDCKKSTTETFAWDSGSQSWFGTITCGSLAVDLKFTIEKVADVCYLFLESNCMGYWGENRPRVPCLDCTQFDDVAFDVDVSGCGDSNCTTATVRVNYADLLEFARLCGDCGGCGCICRCICVTYFDGVAPPCFDMRSVCWDEEEKHWSVTVRCSEVGTSDNTLTFTIVEDSDGSCALRLAPYVGYVINNDKPLGGCPSLAGLSPFTIDLDGEFGGRVNMATVSVACLFCGGLCGTCCDPMPETLTATLTDAGGCPGLTGQTLTLTYDPNRLNLAGTHHGGWYGKATICSSTFEFFLWCSSSLNNIWKLDLIGSSYNCTAGEGTRTMTFFDCEPFEVETLQGTDPAACPYCCNLSGQYKITITE